MMQAKTLGYLAQELCMWLSSLRNVDSVFKLGWESKENDLNLICV